MRQPAGRPVRSACASSSAMPRAAMWPEAQAGAPGQAAMPRRGSSRAVIEAERRWRLRRSASARALGRRRASSISASRREADFVQRRGRRQCPGKAIRRSASDVRRRAGLAAMAQRWSRKATTSPRGKEGERVARFSILARRLPQPEVAARVPTSDLPRPRGSPRGHRARRPRSLRAAAIGGLGPPRSSAKTASGRCRRRASPATASCQSAGRNRPSAAHRPPPRSSVPRVRRRRPPPTLSARAAADQLASTAVADAAASGRGSAISSGSIPASGAGLDRHAGAHRNAQRIDPRAASKRAASVKPAYLQAAARASPP